MVRKYVVALALLLLGCGHAPVQIADRDEYLAEATRAYPKENKERVITAAERILKQSDPNNIDMRYTGDGFVGLRHYLIYAILATANGQEKWEFHTTDAPGGITASLSVSEEGVTTGAYTATHYEGAMNAIPLYRLFWKRMDYMLGKRTDWVACNDEYEALRASGVNADAALGGLCGPTSAGRAAPPPDPLGPNSTKAAKMTPPGFTPQTSPVVPQ